MVRHSGISTNHPGPEEDPRSSAVLKVEKAGEFPIAEVATIGRAPDCNIVLDFRPVSRCHARIFKQGGHYWLKDLDSANGTMLNGKRIKQEMLSDSDRIEFAGVKALFRFTESTRGPAPIGKDPLGDGVSLIGEGPPTGGRLKRSTSSERMDIRQPEKQLTAARARIAVLEREIYILRNANEALRREKDRMSDPEKCESTKEILEKENAHLKDLIAQLERALADSNLRIRNLQNRLDRERR